MTVPTTTTAIRLRLRSVLALVGVSAVGLVGFGWPLLASASASTASGLAHSADAPWLFVVLLPLLLAVLMAELADGGIDAKAIAMLGVLAAVGAALRPFGGGITGIQPMFFLLIPAGRVLGRGFGFVLGGLTMFASALVTGGIGPWLPFQMIGAAWVGFFAGCLPPARGKTELGLLAGYGAVASLAYGLLLNLWFWPFATAGADSGISFDPAAPLGENLAHFFAFDVATSLGFDVPRAIGIVVLVLLAGRPVLLALRRAARRAAFDAPVSFDPDSFVPASFDPDDAAQRRVSVGGPGTEESAGSSSPRSPPSTRSPSSSRSAQTNKPGTSTSYGGSAA